MIETITEAIVLDKTDSGEFDSRVYLFTKDLGKVVAKVTSGRKITSKLAGHLEPLNTVTARIIEKNGIRLVDALSHGQSNKQAHLIKIFSLVKELAAEGQKDLTLWNFLKKALNDKFENKNTAEVLSLLGFDPTFARCNRCQTGKPEKFSVQDMAFYCKKCFP